MTHVRLLWTGDGPVRVAEAVGRQTPSRRRRRQDAESCRQQLVSEAVDPLPVESRPSAQRSAGDKQEAGIWSVSSRLGEPWIPQEEPEAAAKEEPNLLLS